MADYDMTTLPKEPFTHDGVTHDIFRLGEGPAVIVIAEMPGITPKVMEFAERVAAQGLTAVLPHLFGAPGVDPDPGTHGMLASGRYLCGSMIGGCVSKEFTVWASGKSSPIVTWLRALAKAEHERCGGPGVGAVGMCFTGGYALAMAADDVILAPVLSQPSLPLGLTPGRRNSIDISPEELERVKHRCAHEDLKVIGLRFKSDKLVPAGRFRFLREQLGDAFVAVELEDEDAADDSPMPPHSVLTEHLKDEPGEPTRQALDDVLELFRSRLIAG